MRFVSGSLTILCLWLAVPSVANAADYFVATNGADGRSCSDAQNPATPKRTITDAIDCLAAGDTLYVRGGVYSEMLGDNLPSGGSWQSVVRIAAYPGEQVWVVPPPGFNYCVRLVYQQQYVEFDGINLDGSNVNYDAIRIEGWVGGNAHHIRFRNLEVRNAPMNAIVAAASVPGIIGGNEFINLKVHDIGHNDFDHGFYLTSSDNLVENTEIFNTSGAGVHIFNGWGQTASGNVIRNNVIRDGRYTGGGQRHWGIVVANGAWGTQIYNNIVYRIPHEGGASIGLHAFAGQHTEFFNNTIAHNDGEGIVIENSALDIQVLNNISYGNTHGNYRHQFVNPQQGYNLVDIDPHFVNAGGGDFRVLSNSPAIDQGVSVWGVSSDRLGVARPLGAAYDIGAHETSGSGSTQPHTADGTGGGGSSGGGGVVDSSGATWTIGSGGAILRDGDHTGSGYGSEIISHQGTIYVWAGSWYMWNGSYWVDTGAADPRNGSGGGGSSDGGGSSGGGGVVDSSGATWTIGNGGAILRNGVHAEGGYGSLIQIYDGWVYVVGTDGNWWRWTGGGWEYAG